MFDCFPKFIKSNTIQLNVFVKFTNVFVWYVHQQNVYFKKASSNKFSLFIRYCLQHFSNFILCLQRVKTSSKFYHYVLLRQKRRRRPPITRDFCRLSLFCAACRKMNRPAIVPLCTPTWCAATSTTLFSKRSFLVQIKVVIDKN